MSPRSGRRRLATVEDDLPPSGVVLRWLAEMKAHGSLTAYADSLADGPGALEPFERFLALLEPAVKGLGQPGSSPGAARARRRGARQALFRFFLVVRLNLHATTQAPLRLMTALANAYHLDALLARAYPGAVPNEGDAGLSAGWQTWQDQGERLLTELYADRFTRLSLEARFFDGARAVGPDTERDDATVLDLTTATVRAGLAAQTSPAYDALAEFRDAALAQILNAALELAAEHAGAIIAGALADLRDIDALATWRPWASLGLCPPTVEPVAPAASASSRSVRTTRSSPRNRTRRRGSNRLDY